MDPGLPRGPRMGSPRRKRPGGPPPRHDAVDPRVPKMVDSVRRHRRRESAIWGPASSEESRFFALRADGIRHRAWTGPAGQVSGVGFQVSGKKNHAARIFLSRSVFFVLIY